MEIGLGLGFRVSARVRVVVRSENEHLQLDTKWAMGKD
jgi:hypothetical protein